ncbi:MAG: LptF/LptG family permease [Syntrophobacterales bacterium]|jgi:lipopolysaccharide export system permease protein|nr:LptF/LptG family permease [Syntrophobacterales bacterium]
MVNLRVKFIRTLHRRFYIYLLKELIYVFLLSLGILTFILVLSRIGKLADLVINRGVEVKDIVLLIVYSSPPYLTFTLPMAFLLSTIVILGRLSTENEILALKTSGVNLMHLFTPLISVGVAITVFGFLNAGTLLPRAGNLFRDTLLNIVKKGISLDDKEGAFNDTLPDIVVYIDKVNTKDKHLTGILVADDRDQDVKQTISASRGIISLDPVTLNLTFLLENGNLHRWEKKEDTYKNVSFKNYTFIMNLANVLPSNTFVRKRHFEMTNDELRAHIAVAKTESLKYDLLLEIYKKVSIPVSSLAFVFLTVPLGIKRRVEGKFSGILYSLLLFLFYYLLMAVAENVGKSIQMPVLITTFIPNIAIMLIGLYLMRDINRESHTGAALRLRQLWIHCFEKTK